jgi:MFS family permease
MQLRRRKFLHVAADTSPDLVARRAVWAACFGFFVDMFDVYLPIAVLAPALSYFIPAGISGTAQATIFYVVFAVTLIGRPIGSAIFGHFGDRMGRRQTTLISVAVLAL